VGGGMRVTGTSNSYGSTFQVRGEIAGPGAGGVIYLPVMIRGW
jgi:hypothetical protein